MNVCYKCDKNFNSTTDLKRHLNRIKPCNIKTEYKCEICLYCFTSNQSLNKHKNKKIKCKPAIIKLQEENKILKIENQNIKNTSLINNNNSQNYNNSLNTINSNNITNIIFNNTEDIKQYLESKPHSLQNLEEMIDNKQVYKYLKHLTISENYDNYEVLKNTYEINHTLKSIFFNIGVQTNFIILKNFLQDEFLIRLSENNITEITEKSLMYLLYTIFDILIKKDNIDIDLKKYYKKYIDRYKTGINYESNIIKDFYDQIIIKMNESFMDLILSIKDFNSKKVNKLNDKEIKTITALKENKIKVKNNIINEFNTQYLYIPNKTIIEEIQKEINIIINEIYFIDSKKIMYTFEKELFQYINIIIFFMYKFFWENEKNNNIKALNNKFYIYSINKTFEIDYNKKLDDNWYEINIDYLYELILKKIINTLNYHKFKYDNLNLEIFENPRLIYIMVYSIYNKDKKIKFDKNNELIIKI